VNFTATPSARFSISGKVTTGGSGLAGVTVSTNGASATTATTATDGTYTLSGLAVGTYTVSPSRTGYAFSPTYRTISLSTANASGINFTATDNGGLYSLKGVVTLGGSGLSGVKVAAGSKSATTAASGAYTLTGVSAGTYQVTPSREGYSFSPNSRSVTVAGDTTGINFSAQVVTTLISISVNKPTVKGKQKVTGTVRFNRKVPVATTVVLSSSDPAARVPSSVRVKKGKSQAKFSVATRKVRIVTPVILTARSGATTKTTQLTVKP
jgi:hypothetical protein